MDNSNRRFLAISRNLLRVFRAIDKRLRSLNRDIQKQAEAISIASEAESKRETTPPILRAEIEIPPRIYEQKIASEARNDKRENFRKYVELATLIVEALTFVAVVAYALINYCMLREMTNANRSAADSFQKTLNQMEGQADAQKEAAAAAKHSADTARDALVKANRPWLGVEGLPIGDLKTDVSSFSISVKNSGTAPAFKVGVSMKSSNWQDFAKNIGPICAESKKRAENGIYMFPNDVHPFSPGTVHEVYPGGNPHAKEIFSITGCIVYLDQFNELHRTEFCFTSGLPIGESAHKQMTPCFVRQKAD